MSARLKDVELKMDQLLNNVNLLVSKLDKKEQIAKRHQPGYLWA